MFSIGIGSKTSTGGEVVEGNDGIMMSGLVASSVGHQATCQSGRKECRGIGPIVAVGARDVFLPAGAAARVGDYVDCGCPPGFNSLIGSNCVEIGRFSSNPKAPFSSFSDISQSLIQEENRQSSIKAAETTSSKTVQIPQDSAYWPPYDFTRDKPLEVEFTQKAVELAVMSLEEAEEFANNLWLEYSGKSTLENFKKIWDGVDNTHKAYQLAKGLGGMGVVVYTKPANGKDYIIIKGYKRHLKTLVKGNRWRANHPQVVQLGLGTKNMARRMLKMGLVVDIIFSVAINAVDVYVHDEKTMEDFIGRSGVDIAKGVIATGLGTLAAIIMASNPIVVSGMAFAAISFLANVGLDWIDNSFGISDALVDKLKEISA